MLIVSIILNLFCICNKKKKGIEKEKTDIQERKMEGGVQGIRRELEKESNTIQSCHGEELCAKYP